MDEHWFLHPSSHFPKNLTINILPSQVPVYVAQIPFLFLVQLFINNFETIYYQRINTVNVSPTHNHQSTLEILETCFFTIPIQINISFFCNFSLEWNVVNKGIVVPLNIAPLNNLKIMLA